MNATDIVSTSAVQNCNVSTIRSATGKMRKQHGKHRWHELSLWLLCFEPTIHRKNSTPRHGECWAAKQVQAFLRKTAI